VAVKLVYYEVLRQATLEDVATKVDRSRATFDEHFQKIEAKILLRIDRYSGTVSDCHPNYTVVRQNAFMSAQITLS
jgi:hypothetical protein